MELLPAVLVPLVALNNRATEFVKMVLRDQLQIDDNFRRFLTLLFSYLFGVVSVAVVVSGGADLSSTILSPFTGNVVLLSVVSGALVSFGGAAAQPLLELVAALSNRVQPTINEES